MQAVSILKTDGGPHSAVQWATVTAQHLVPIDMSMPDDRLFLAQKLQLAVVEALIGHHNRVQQAERGHLETRGDARLAEPLDATEHVEAAMAEITRAAAGTPWEAKFHDPQVQAEQRAVLHNHFHTSQAIERSWHKARKGA